MESNIVETIATFQFADGDHLYQVVDFLNRTLKSYDLAFGLSKETDGCLYLSVYEITTSPDT
ncbi:hypothetical protein skT53_04220 [Effusibacillus dendaii]|uniref:DUF4264 domain-containing protein n=1 Tax=Effusibacillus dendaii TaxID=2743772 RepID=A0A7I8D617_9BACL|nr:hypothetical protein skT53_04220 [Effusibacillus dendaii]